ncbi:unnamed protein product [Choristocarpus tenellus]
MRNLVDAQVLLESGAISKERLTLKTFKRPSKEDIQAVQKALKLTTGQIEIAYDIIKAGIVDMKDREMLKSYRLMVKRRLFKLHLHDLSSDPVVRKKQLEELYAELEHDYTVIVPKVFEKFSECDCSGDIRFVSSGCE